MSVSQNGYPVGRAHVAIYGVPGTTVQLALRRGPVARVLLELARRFDNEVEDLDTLRSYSEDPRPDVPGGGPSSVADDWSYAARPVRGSTTTISNHASGTAIDVNATQHPRGVRGTFTATQKARVRRILAALADPRTGRAIIRWGEDYTRSPVDGMHFEIHADEAAVARVAAKLEERDMATLTDKEWRHLIRGVPVLRNLNGPNPDTVTWTVAAGLQNADQKLDDIKALVRAQGTTLQAILAALADLTPDGVRAVMADAAERIGEQLAALDVRITVAPPDEDT